VRHLPIRPQGVLEALALGSHGPVILSFQLPFALVPLVQLKYGGGKARKFSLILRTSKSTVDSVLSALLKRARGVKSWSGKALEYFGLCFRFPSPAPDTLIHLIYGVLLPVKASLDLPSLLVSCTSVTVAYT
jgi:hypothetical protein